MITMKAHIDLHQFPLRQWLQDLPHLSQIIISEDNFQIHAPCGLYLEGLITGDIFCVSDLGGFYMEGLIHGGAYFQNFTVFPFHTRE